ncbi:DUF4142 domain-containing protein [Catellatospora sichuanensis]|uniref:DUF4142 domain-containing protein n=1 Tax=Catellatospora sichuanensis TaxID=1969805 RepID=UPI0016431963|nr:DUF4142 domain-containing protein [Catellatospora sichuanensis]
MAVLLAGAAMAVTATAAASPAVAVQPSEQDTAWMVAAHQANLAEIATGKMAQAKSSSAAVKDLGQRFVTDHAKLDASLKALAQELKVSLPAEPNAEQKAVADKLQAAAAGDEFNKMWIEQQLAAHTKSMKATQQEIDKGEAAQVKEAAEAAMPVITAHHEALIKAAPDFGVKPQ